MNSIDALKAFIEGGQNAQRAVRDAERFMALTQSDARRDPVDGDHIRGHHHGLSVADMIRFKIDGPILPWQRPAQVGKRRFDPPEQVAYKEMVGWYYKKAALEQRFKGGLEEISLGVDVFFPHLGSAKIIKLFKTSRPDLDNIIKNIKDALNKIAWRDDSQVVHYSRCGKWFLPPTHPSKDGFAWVTIRKAPTDEYPADLI